MTAYNHVYALANKEIGKFFLGWMWKELIFDAPMNCNYNNFGSGISGSFDVKFDLLFVYIVNNDVFSDRKSVGAVCIIKKTYLEVIYVFNKGN